MVRAPRPVPSPPEPVECLLRGPLPCPRPPRLAPGAGEGLPSVGELLFQPLHRGFQLVLGRRGGVGRPAGLGRCLLGLGNRRPVPAFPLRPQLVRRRCCWRPGARVRGCLSPRRPGPTHLPGPPRCFDPAPPTLHHGQGRPAHRTKDSISSRRCCDSSLMAEPSSESCAARNSPPSSASSAVTPGSARTSLLRLQADRGGLRRAAICLAAGPG